MRKTVYFLICIFLLTSCKNEKTIWREGEDKWQDSLDIELVTTFKKMFLGEVLPDGNIKRPYVNENNRDSLNKVAYQLLKENKTFQEKGLYGYIAEFGSGILIANRKFKELDSLLKDNNYLNSFEDEIRKKQVTFFAYKDEDNAKAQKAIKEAENMIRKKITKRENITEDTNQLFMVFYFIDNRYIWKGREAGFSVLDSFIKIDKSLEDYRRNIEESFEVRKEIFPNM